MEMIIDYIILTLVIAMGIGTYVIGINLNKRPGWIYLLNTICGVLIGCLLGYLRGDIRSGLPVGIIITLLFVLGGLVLRWQRQQILKLKHRRDKQSKE